MPDEEYAGPTGSVAVPTLKRIRENYRSEEPLVDTAQLDDPVAPTALVVEFSTGVRNEGRVEITWWNGGDYRFHYTEQNGLDFRFDRHQKESAPDTHFHPPPAAGPAEPSVLTTVDQPLAGYRR